MPKLVDFLGQYKDMAEEMLVLAIHEDGPASLDAVRSEVRAMAAQMGRPAALPPIILLDSKQGMFLSYDPEALGDMVLLDPRGDVVETGDRCLETLKHELDRARSRVAKATDILAEAKNAVAMTNRMEELFELGLGSAARAAVEYARDCPLKLAPAVFEALARHGGAVGREFLAGGHGLHHEDAKRRAAAMAAMASLEAPEFAAPLLEFAKQEGIKPKELCLALHLAVKLDPKGAQVQTDILEFSKSKSSKVRGCCAELLGQIGSTEAQARLVQMLTKERFVAVRRKAVAGLAAIGSDEALAHLRRVSKEDKAKSVRAAAAKALEGR